MNSLGHVLFPFARWQHDHAQTPLPCETSMTRACWAVATGHSPSPVGRVDCMCLHAWTSMCLAPVRCRVLLHSLLPTDDACSSSSLSTSSLVSLNYMVGQKVTKFGIFSDTARKLSAFTPESGRILKFSENLVKHRWLLYTCARFGELWPTNPDIDA